jgi:hypothetical protein
VSVQRALEHGSLACDAIPSANYSHDLLAHSILTAHQIIIGSWSTRASAITHSGQTPSRVEKWSFEARTGAKHFHPTGALRRDSCS